MTGKLAGAGIDIKGGATGDGIRIGGANALPTTATGAGLNVSSGAAGIEAVRVKGNTTGAGITVTGGNAANGITVSAAAGHGLSLSGAGSGNADVALINAGMLEPSTDDLTTTMKTSIGTAVNAAFVLASGTVETATGITGAYTGFTELVSTMTGTPPASGSIVINGVQLAYAYSSTGSPAMGTFLFSLPTATIPSGAWSIPKAASSGGSVDLSEITASLNNILTPLQFANTKLSSLGSGWVTMTSPVDQAGRALSIIRGDDYTLASGRTIDFVDPGDWPTLTGATLTFTVRNPAGVVQLLITGSLTLLTVGTQVIGDVVTPITKQLVRFQPTHTQTAAMAVATLYAPHLFDIQATLTDGTIRTLVLPGTCVVIADITHA